MSLDTTNKYINNLNLTDNDSDQSKQNRYRAFNLANPLIILQHA